MSERLNAEHRERNPVNLSSQRRGYNVLEGLTLVSHEDINTERKVVKLPAILFKEYEFYALVASFSAYLGNLVGITSLLV